MSVTGLQRQAVRLLTFCALVLAPTNARADEFSVRAIGTILGSCGFTVSSSFPPDADLTVPGSINAGALVNCGVPFRVHAASASGALRNSAPAASGFTNFLGYTLSVSVMLDGGSAISASCGSATLVAGQSSCALSPFNATGLSSGAGIATNKTATLTASWGSPGSAHLAAGTYSDTLTITIAAAP